MGGSAELGNYPELVHNDVIDIAHCAPVHNTHTHTHIAKVFVSFYLFDFS